MKIQKFLLEYAPDFCWVTDFDLFLMAEQIDEDVCWFSFKQVLWQLKRKGYFKTRTAQGPHHKSGPKGLEYLRISK